MLGLKDAVQPLSSNFLRFVVRAAIFAHLELGTEESNKQT